MKMKQKKLNLCKRQIKSPVFSVDFYPPEMTSTSALFSLSFTLSHKLCLPLSMWPRIGRLEPDGTYCDLHPLYIITYYLGVPTVVK